MIFYIFYKNASGMKRHIIKVIILSSIILGYSLVNQYPVAQEYYTLVEPYNHGSSDLVIDLITVESGLKQAAFAASNDTSVFNVSLDYHEMTNAIIEVLHSYSNGLKYTVVGVDSVNRRIYINSTDDQRFLPIFIIEGRKISSCNEALYYYSNTKGYNVGDVITVGNSSRRIVGLFASAPVLGSALLTDDYVITCGDPYTGDPMIFVDMNGKTQVNPVRTEIYREMLREFFGISELPSSGNLTRGMGGIYDISTLRKEAWRMFNEEYGMRTEWGVILIATLLIYSAYLARVALIDVGDSLRGLIALLYSQGALDSHVALLLSLQTLTYVVPSLFIGIVIGYEFMRAVLDAFIPFILAFKWISSLFIAGVLFSLVLAIAVGMYNVRRIGLSSTLRGE